MEGKLVGPAFADVARKYVHDPEAAARLAQKVVTGGGGVWSPLAMPPNALINETEASAILKYVLSLADPNAGQLPLTSKFAPVLPEDDAARGSVVIRAVYTDMGAEQVPPLTGTTIRVLRSPVLDATSAGVKTQTESGSRGLVAKRGATIGFSGIDLTGVKQIEIAAMAMVPDSQLGGTIQVRLDSASGELLGEGKITPRDPFANRRPGGPGGPAPARPPAGTNAVRADAPPGALPGPGARPPGGPARRPASRASYNPFAMPGTRVDIAEVNGKHDLYLVISNDAAADGAKLMTVSSIRLNADRNHPNPDGQR